MLELLRLALELLGLGGEYRAGRFEALPARCCSCVSKHLELVGHRRNATR